MSEKTIIRHDCSQKERIAELMKNESQVVHDVKVLKEDLDEHREAQRKHEAELSIYMKESQENLKRVMDVMNFKLLPVYEQSDRNWIADEVIKERSTNW